MVWRLLACAVALGVIALSFAYPAHAALLADAVVATPAPADTTTQSSTAMQPGQYVFLALVVAALLACTFGFIAEYIKVARNAKRD